MSAALTHPFAADEQAEGFALAESFLDRFTQGPVECDGLAQAVALARMGSMERLRGFCARIQHELEVRRDAS